MRGLGGCGLEGSLMLGGCWVRDGAGDEAVAYLLGRLLGPFGCDFGVGHCCARGGEVRYALLRGCKRSWWEGGVGAMLTGVCLLGA